MTSNSEADSVAALREELVACREELEQARLEHRLEMTKAKITIAELQLQMREAAESNTQTLTATVEELTAVAEGLRERLESEMTERDEFLAVLTGQAEELAQLRTENETLGDLYEHQAKANAELTQTHEQTEELLRTECEIARADLDVVKSVYEEVLTKVVEEKAYLVDVVAALTEEKMQLEMTIEAFSRCEESQSAVLSHKSSYTSPSQPSVSAHPPIPPGLQTGLAEVELETLRGKLLAVEAELLLFKQREPEIEQWTTHRVRMVEDYKSVCDENARLKARVQQTDHMLATAEQNLHHSKEKIDALYSEQQKLMLAPPTIAGLELRYSHLAIEQLQQRILTLENEAAAELWRAVPDIVMPTARYDEIEWQRVLSWRRDLVAEVTRNVLLEEPPQNLDDLHKTMAAQSMRIDNLMLQNGLTAS